jgi:hypothetical protein
MGVDLHVSIGDKYRMSVYELRRDITWSLGRREVCNLFRASRMGFRDFGNACMEVFREDVWDQYYV